MDMWYSWSVRGTDVGQAAIATGFAESDGPGLAQQQAAAILRCSEHALIARVMENWPGGGQWYGRRDHRGGICWWQLAQEE